MVKLHFFLLGVLTLRYVSAAPSDISGLEDITKKENEESHDKHATSLLDDIKGHGNSKKAKRHKRMYDFYVGGGHPPMNPIAYPSYGPPPYSGGYGPPPTLEDPLTQIYKKLQDIASEVRRQSRPPPPHLPQQFPVYFPVIYIPQVPCSCTPNQPSPTPSATNANGTSPDINSRFPAMEDSRQNWGFVETQNNNNNADDEDEYVRPLSFEPLRPNRPLGRSPPAVDHGSRDGDLQASQTIMPPFLAAASSSTNLNSVDEPTACDAAVFICCDRHKEKYAGCFVANGCSGLAENGNNCAENIIGNVIAKYQRYYGQIKG